MGPNWVASSERSQPISPTSKSNCFSAWKVIPPRASGKAWAWPRWVSIGRHESGPQPVEAVEKPGIASNGWIFQRSRSINKIIIVSNQVMDIYGIPAMIPSLGWTSEYGALSVFHSSPVATDGALSCRPLSDPHFAHLGHFAKASETMRLSPQHVKTRCHPGSSAIFFNPFHLCSKVLNKRKKPTNQNVCLAGNLRTSLNMLLRSRLVM